MQQLPISIPDQILSFYGDLDFFCFGFGLDDSLKADGQILLMPHTLHLGLNGVQIVCPNPTYMKIFRIFNLEQ
jgi:hypothetical protein